MQLFIRGAAAAMGVLLFAITLTAQQPPPGGQSTPAPGTPGDGRAGGQGRQGGGQGGAQAGGGRGFTNLQVLPRDIQPQQLAALMQGFTAALGVTCDHCHVMGNRGADDKQAKKTARVMMLAARDFNAKLTPADLGKDAANITPVMCGTCHRGKAIPDWVQPPPPARGGGAAPAAPAAPGAGRGN